MSTEVDDRVPVRSDAARDVLRHSAHTAAAAGYFVFPVLPRRKTPAIEDWEANATRDPAQITQWWTDNSGKNVGIATGPSGLVVIDLDQGHGDTAPSSFAGARNGADVLSRLAEAAGAPAPTDTFTVLTPAGGRHLYFRAPTGIELRNTQGRLGWKIDTRANGGCVVAAGSIGPNGSYRVAEPVAPVRELPGWLLDALTPAPPEHRPMTASRAPRRPTSGRALAYLHAIVAAEAALVASAAPGTRHTTLLRGALKLGSLIGGGALTEDDARAALLPAATEHLGRRECDCTVASINRTISDGLAHGQRQPRHL